MCGIRTSAGLLASGLPVRFAVTVVGVKATWWVGFILGIILGLIGFIQKDSRKMFIFTLQAFLITIVITLLTGLIGLLYGFTVLVSKDMSYFRYWYIPNNLVNFKNFIAVGLMHNFSYAGGLIGLLFGTAWQIIRRVKDRNLN